MKQDIIRVTRTIDNFELTRMDSDMIDYFKQDMLNNSIYNMINHAKEKITIHEKEDIETDTLQLTYSLAILEVDEYKRLKKIEEIFNSLNLEGFDIK